MGIKTQIKFSIKKRLVLTQSVNAETSLQEPYLLLLDTSDN